MIMLDKRKIILAAIAFLVLLGGFLVFKYGLKKEVGREKVEIVVWSLFDDSDAFKDLKDQFESAFPYITLNYYKKTALNYETDLLDALATGRGPDVFLVHNTWLAKHKNKFYPVPSDWLSVRDFQDTFVDVTAQDFIDQDGQIYSLPVWCDTLALFWNKDYFNEAGIARPPVNWEEFANDVALLTVKDANNNILRSGAAIGTARNINRSSDLLSLLMLQTGTQMVDARENKAVFDKAVQLNGQSYNSGEEALRFYTDFANSQKTVYTWNAQKDYSIDAFVEGETAMIFNYAYNLPLIKAKAPYLNFAVAAMPQPADSAKKVNYANYWSFAVSRTSQYPEPAWTFVWWLAQKDNAQEYLQTFVRPAARRDLVTQQKSDTTLGVFAEQALSAYSWYQVDNTSIEQIFADMIEDVVAGNATVREAIVRGASRVNELMK